MSIRNYTSRLSEKECADRIVQRLLDAGAAEAVSYFMGTAMKAVSFHVEAEDGDLIPHVIRPNSSAVLQAVTKDPETPRYAQNGDQPTRTAWKNTLDWVDLCAVQAETGQATLLQLFRGFRRRKDIPALAALKDTAEEQLHQDKEAA